MINGLDWRMSESANGILQDIVPDFRRRTEIILTQESQTPDLESNPGRLIYDITF
jgi:hypothetical protein